MREHEHAEQKSKPRHKHRAGDLNGVLGQKLIGQRKGKNNRRRKSPRDNLLRKMHLIAERAQHFEGADCGEREYKQIEKESVHVNFQQEKPDQYGKITDTRQ